MKRTCVSNKLIAVFALVAIMTIAGAFLCCVQVTYAESGIIYSDPIIVTYDGAVYSYGNNGTFLTSDSLKNALDVIAQNASSNIILNFKNVSTDEQLCLDYDYPVVMQGELNYLGNSSPFIIVKRNELRLQGVDILSSVTAITVNEGAILNSYSGTVKTAPGKAVLTSTLINYGTVSIDGGVIVYDNSVSQGSGLAVSQYGEKSLFTLTKGRIEGNSGIQVNQGMVSLSGGAVSATHSYSENIANGYALMVSNNGNVTIDGANINSVTPERVLLIDGVNNSSFVYSSGRIEGNIVLNMGGTDFTSVKVLDKRIYPDQNGSVYLYSPSNVLEETSYIYLGVECNRGFYVKGWSENVEASSPKLSDFSGESVKVTLDNSYKITLTLGNKSKTLSFDYNSTVYPQVWGFTPGDGQTVLYWRDSSGEKVDMPVQVSKNESYTAVLEIADTVIDNIEDISCVYGDDISIVPKFVEVEDFDYSYEWQRLENVSISDGQGGIMISTEFVKVSDSKNCILKNVADSGTYRLKLITAFGDNEKVNYSNEFNVQISKADYSDISHEALSGIYSPEKKLSDYLLSDGFSWLNPEIIPSVDVAKYPANYCGDSENYNTYSLFVTIALRKHEAVRQSYPYAYYQNRTIVYDADKTLNDYPLENNWRWADGTIIPTVDNEGYIAYYNPDSINYEDYGFLIKMQVTKAAAIEAEPLSCEIVFKNGLTVKDALDLFKLPDDYLFKNVGDIDKVIANYGSMTFDIYYNPDVVNYEDYSTTLTINAIRQKENETDYPEIIYIPFEEGLKLSDIELREGWKWVNGEESVKSGKNVYSATYSSDYALFEPFVTIITVVAYDKSLCLDKINIRYISGLKLSDITLPDNYTWVDESTSISVGEYIYKATYSTQSYEIVIDVTVVVNKSIYDISSITFEDKTIPYDGNSYSLSYSGVLPDGLTCKAYPEGYLQNIEFRDAGEYRFVLEFISNDSNYEDVDSQYALLTIMPVEYDLTNIWDDVTIVYDGKEHSLTCEESELPDGVTIKSYIGDNSFVNSGKYTVGVEFSQVDTLNHVVLGTVYRTLTIEKSDGSIVGNSRQTVVYDGYIHSPVVMSANKEQAPICNGSDEFTEPGKYEVVYHVEESINYKAFSKTIEFVILPKVLQTAFDSIGLSSTVFSENGIEGTELTIKVTNNDENVLDVSISIDNFPLCEGYTVTLDLSEIANKRDITVSSLIDGEIQEISYELNGNSITFNSIGENYRLCFTDRITPIWVWIIVSIACVVAIIGILFVVRAIIIKKSGVDILKRKRKEQ